MLAVSVPASWRHFTNRRLTSRWPHRFFPSQLFIWRAQLHSQLFRGFHSLLWQCVLTAGYSTESNLLYFRQLLLLYCANLHHQNSSVPSEEMRGKRRRHERLTNISMQVTVCSAFFLSVARVPYHECYPPGFLCYHLSTLHFSFFSNLWTLTLSSFSLNLI